MSVRIYSNWNKRSTDQQEQIEPYRKYIFICEGANTETRYIRRLIELRKQLNIHPMIDIRLGEKTDEDKNISDPRKLVLLAEKCKASNDFDKKQDKVVVIFDADIFERNEAGYSYDELIANAEQKDDIIGVTNPAFEVFLLLHKVDAYQKYIKGHEEEFLHTKKYAYNCLLDATHMNSKTNKRIGELAQDVLVAIQQEVHINQDIHNVLGNVSCNIGQIIQLIMNDQPEI